MTLGLERDQTYYISQHGEQMQTFSFNSRQNDYRIISLLYLNSSFYQWKWKQETPEGSVC